MNEVKDYVSLIAPEKAGIVKLYTGKVPIFDNFSITKQIKAGFGRVVNYSMVRISSSSIPKPCM